MPLPLLFDLDGTLVHSLPDIAASANHLRIELGLLPVDLDTVRSWIGEGLLHLLQQATQEVPGLDLDEAVQIYRAHHHDQCTRLVAPFPGVQQALHAWQLAGHPMAVVTNKPEVFARRVLDHLGLAGYFGAVVGGDTCTTRKPDPEPVRRALELLACPPGRGLMVGDSPGDVLAGRGAGLQTAAVSFGYRSETDLMAVTPDLWWHDMQRPPLPQ